MRFSLFVLGLSFIIGMVDNAQAAEMKLWPNQRANHQSEMNERAAEYKQRGTDYVNHTYSTGGEEPIPAADNLFEKRDYSIPGGVAGASKNANDIKARRVDVNEIAEIIKGDGHIIPPEPPLDAGSNEPSILGKRGLRQ